MCYKQNRRFNFKGVQDDDWNKFIENISKCKCKFDGGKFKSDQWWNNNKCQCKMLMWM